jgi:hypothetical protein
MGFRRYSASFAQFHVALMRQERRALSEKYRKGVYPYVGYLMDVVFPGAQVWKACAGLLQSFDQVG